MTREETHTNFQAIVRDLVAAGWREAAIANAVGVTQPRISQIKHGKPTRIGFDVGTKLMKLHKKEMKKFQERVHGPRSAASKN